MNLSLYNILICLPSWKNILPRRKYMHVFEVLEMSKRAFSLKTLIVWHQYVHIVNETFLETLVSVETIQQIVHFTITQLADQQTSE